MHAPIHARTTPAHTRRPTNSDVSGNAAIQEGPHQTEQSGVKPPLLSPPHPRATSAGVAQRGTDQRAADCLHMLPFLRLLRQLRQGLLHAMHFAVSLFFAITPYPVRSPSTSSTRGYPSKTASTEGTA